MSATLGRNFTKLARWAGLALACITAPAGAQNQSQWQFYAPQDHAEVRAFASICPLLDQETANFFCIGFGCYRDGPVSWVIEFAGAGLIPDELRATLSVDNRTLAAIPMTRHSDHSRMRYTAAFSPTEHATHLQQLRSGSTGVFFFDTEWINPVSFSLTGSSAAYDAALAACPAPGAAAGGITPEMLDPVQAARRQIAGFCNGATPEQVILGPQFETRRDVTGDGIDDVILMYGDAVCPGRSTSDYCGSGGCTHSVWAGLPEGGYREIFHDTVYSVSSRSLTLFEVEVHGSACGRTGASGPCLRQFIIDADGNLSPFNPSP